MNNKGEINYLKSIVSDLVKRVEYLETKSTKDNKEILSLKSIVNKLKEDNIKLTRNLNMLKLDQRHDENNETKNMQQKQYNKNNKNRARSNKYNKKHQNDSEEESDNKEIKEQFITLGDKTDSDEDI